VNTNLSHDSSRAQNQPESLGTELRRAAILLLSAAALLPTLGCKHLGEISADQVRDSLAGQALNRTIDYRQGQLARLDMFDTTFYSPRLRQLIGESNGLLYTLDPETYAITSPKGFPKLAPVDPALFTKPDKLKIYGYATQLDNEVVFEVPVRPIEK
jgi:hypothetical protein